MQLTSFMIYGILHWQIQVTMGMTVSVRDEG